MSIALGARTREPGPLSHRGRGGWRRFTNTSRVDYTAVGVVAFIARLPAYLAHTYAHPDDATFGMSILAMRHGGVPFRDVFSSQGPLHLPLLFVGDLVGL